MDKYFTFNKGDNIQLTTNFNSSEFECKCSEQHVCKISVDLVNKLQSIREFIEKPIIINSGYRCEAHNKKVSGSAKSQHLLGNAVDVALDSKDPRDFAISLKSKAYSFAGIGMYDTFIHVDVREGEHAYWDYRTKK